MTGALLADRFEIEHHVESGGMGAVYRALDRRTGGRVALKLMLPNSGERMLSERFTREGRLLSELSHPHIVSYVAHGETADGRLYLAMEWLEGEELRHRLRRGPLSIRATVALLRHVAEALGVAHRRGVVHRDLKPSNLFLVGGEVGRVKVLDFGIARRVEASIAMTQTGVALGTPLYMAPETACRDREVTPATDIFALGSVVYECLAGEPPFVAGTYARILKRILCEDPEPVEARRPEVPGPLAALIQRMLEKQLSRRIPDGGAVLAALDALGELPEEPPSSPFAPASVAPSGGPERTATAGPSPDASTVTSFASAATEPGRAAPSEPLHDAAPDNPPGARGPGGPMFQEGQVLAGRYEILRFISSGGAGEVYVAEDRVLHVRVALKGIRESAARGAIERFKQEIRLARSISHQNVCRIFDIGRHDGGGAAAFFLTMELLDGESLAARIARQGRIPTAEARPLVGQIVAALGAAHEQGVVHRDLKPQNVLIVPSRSGGRAVVADFGLALALATETAEDGGVTRLTAEGGIAGTPAYAAPEQVDGGPVTPRTDVYALGVVMYEMVTGELPFKGETVTVMVAARLVEPPRPPSALVPDLDPRWDAAIMRCLERDPEARFASVADVLTAVDPPRSLRPSSRPPYRPRSRWLPGVGAAAGLAALGLVVFFSIGRELSRTRAEGDPPPPQGSSRRLTAESGWAAEPAISPDGKLVAYVSDEKGSADIWVVDAAGGDPRRLTADPAEHHTPTWFADNGAIAYASGDEIWKVPVAGGAPTPLLAGKDPAISPDGKRVAFVRPDTGGRELVWVAELAELDRPRALTKVGDGSMQQRHPAWSPDGSTIAYKDVSRIWIVPADGSGAPRRTEGNEICPGGWPSFSPDGKHLYFASRRVDPASGSTRGAPSSRAPAPSYAIWRLSTGDGHLARLTLGTGPEVEPSVSRDGAHLAYSTYHPERALVIVDRKKGTQTRMRDVVAFALAPDGSKVVYSPAQEAHYDLWEQPLEKGVPRGEPRQLTELDGTLAKPAFSPDGEWIAAFRVIEGRQDIWILPAEGLPRGGAPERITSDGAAVQPVWSHDGKHLAFLSDKGDKAQLWTVPVASGRAAGEARQITFDETDKALPTWSPRGDEIAYVAATAHGDEIAVVKVAGGPPRLITTGAHVSSVHWDPKTGEIYASGTWGGSLVSLRRVSPSTGEVRRLDDVDVGFGNVALGNFDVSEDGSTLAVRYEEARGDIWILDAVNGTRY